MSGNGPFFVSSGDSSDNWISIADLMAGLMMVFLLLAIWHSASESPPTPVPPRTLEQEAEPTDPIDQTLRILKDLEEEIRQALKDEFGKDLEKWSAEILDGDITIRFLDRDIFFEQGEHELKPQFQEILDDFFPRYVRVLHDGFSDVIREVRIEGHTSSEWLVGDEEGGNRERIAFIKNMELSQGRTRETMEYVIDLPRLYPYEAWMIKKVTANGLSSARLLDSEGAEVGEGGVEDREMSRRVEFAVHVDALRALSQINLEELQGSDEP